MPSPRVLVLAATAAVLIGCSPILTSLREQVDARDYQAAVEDGEAWLVDNRTNPDEKGTVPEVQLLVARAGLELARQRDTVEAYQAFAKRWKPHERVVGPQLKTAWEAESHAYFRDVTSGEKTIKAYERFREEYPGAPDTANSKREQAEVAFAPAAERDGISAYSQWLMTYESWPEAAALVTRARTRIVELAWLDAKAAHKPKRYKEFRTTYADWPEAQSAGYLADSRVREVSSAYDRATEAATPAVHRSFRASYADWPEAADAVAASRLAELKIAHHAADSAATVEAHQAFRASYASWPEAAQAVADSRLAELDIAWSPLEASQELRPLAAFAQAYADWPEAGERVTRARTRVIKLALALAEKNRQIDFCRAFVRQYRDWPEATDALARVRELELEIAWARVEKTTDYKVMRRFVQDYPDAPQAAEAEVRADELWGFYGPAGPNELKTAVNALDDRARDRVTAYVQVKDADGVPVGGLSADHFKAYAEGRGVEVLEFGGMERQRPVDITFVLDVTGSMRASIAGTKAAAVRFAERLALGNRDMRLGLVTFGDEIRGLYPGKKKSLTKSVDRFKEWVGSQVAAGGGDRPENALAALDTALRQLKYREEAQLVFILITDAPAHERNRYTRLTADKIGRALRERGVTLFTLGPRSRQYLGLTTFLGGTVMPLGGHFGQLMDHVSLITAKQYRLVLSRAVPRNPSKPPAIRVRAEREHLWIPWGRLPSEQITSVAVDPNDSAHVVAATADAGLFSSTDGGRSWNQTQTGAFQWIAFSSLDGKALLAWGKDATVLHSADGGRSWTRPSALPTAGVSALVAAPDVPSLLYASDASGLWRTEDGGTRWVSMSVPPTSARIVRLAVDPVGAGGLWVTTADGKVFLTADGGASWEALAIASPDPARRVSEFQLHRHRAWGGATLALGPAGRLFRSIDRGRTWAQASPTGRPGAGELRVLSVRHSHSPKRGGWILLETNQGVFVSSDVARSWRFLHGDSGGGGMRVASSRDGRMTAVGSKSGESYKLEPVADREFLSGSVYFKTGSSSVGKRLAPHLDRLARHLKKHPKIRAHVAGHTDDVGEEEKNKALSLARAESVRTYLEGQGIPASRIVTIGLGESRPLFPNDSRRNRARNRRVELTLLDGEG